MQTSHILGVFDALDIDGDGYLFRAEFVTHYVGAGEELGDVLARFDDVDFDGDGRIDVQEFVAARR